MNSTPTENEPISPGISTGEFVENPVSDDIENAWKLCLIELQSELSAAEYTLLVTPLAYFIRYNHLMLGAPNRYVVDQIKHELMGKIAGLMEAQLRPIKPDISIQVGDLESLKRSKVIEPRAKPTRNRGRTSESVVEQAQLDLFQLERKGQFTAVAISPQNEFPTLLTRLPIFVPGRAQKQRALLDKDNALPFETSWGTGRKFGPFLTVYDEDTLMALGRLRQNMLIGDPGNMPYPISKLYAKGGDAEVHVHVVMCMLSDIQNMCGTSVGGRNNKLRLDSIKRLAGTKIEFSKETSDKAEITGTTIDLIHVKWDVYEENALLYIQFSPIMAAWLERSYTYIDWKLRRKLRTDVGKAVHRFLSGQRKDYSIFTKKLQSAIGYTGPYKHFMTDLREALLQLQQFGWLKAFQIEGNGRKAPHKLTLKR